MCLSSPAAVNAADAGAPYVQNSMVATFGIIGPVFLAAAMVLFTFTTLLGNFYYVESCFAYLCGRTPDKKVLILVRIIGALLIALGSGIKMDIAWGIADISQCILAFINIPVCIIIGSRAYLALDDYIRQRREGINPVFNAAAAKIQEPTDFWK